MYICAFVIPDFESSFMEFCCILNSLKYNKTL